MDAFARRGLQQLVRTMPDSRGFDALAWKRDRFCRRHEWKRQPYRHGLVKLLSSAAVGVVLSARVM